MKLLFHVVEVTRLLSSIIKGQRIRSESKLEIKNTKAYVAQEPAKENLQSKVKEQEQAIENKLRQANAKANDLIQLATEEATAKAAIIIKEAEDRITRESAIAFEQAQEDGYNAGYEKGRLESEQLVEEGKQIVIAAKEEKQKLIDELEPEMIDLVLKVCSKVISDEIHYNKDTILVLIRQTLAKASADPEEIVIKVSELDYDHVVENKDLITANTITPEQVTIVKDLNLTIGSCVIETEFGSIRSSINEAFSAIKKQMRLLSTKK